MVSKPFLRLRCQTLFFASSLSSWTAQALAQIKEIRMDLSTCKLAWPAQTLRAVWPSGVGLTGWPTLPVEVLDVISFAQRCYEAVLAVVTPVAKQSETLECRMVFLRQFQTRTRICRQQQNSFDC
ncbi:hypothetical protein H4582DRAFT_779167 [Lactarius indigo]|nr:hypothetical protein H4582DRAFT_779167 [Lactarius indigo]